MKGKIYTIFAVAVMATALAACAKKPPACGDDATLGVVRNIIMEQVNKMTGSPDSEDAKWFNSLTKEEILGNLAFEFPRASAYDDKIAKYSCEAKLKAGTADPIAMNYTSQLDDRGAQIVSIDGFTQGNWRSIAGGLIASVNKRRDAALTPEQRQEAFRQRSVSQGGLTWMPITSTKNWSEANAYCNTSTINGQTGWRLPTKVELSALYDSGAMKDRGWTLSYTWSSTVYSAGSHYYVYLGFSAVGWDGDAHNYYVSCVR